LSNFICPTKACPTTSCPSAAFPIMYSLRFI
jgi:hypothetical protein